jgi:hypothetical protein
MTPPLADQLEQAAPRVFVVAVRPQVIRKLRDARRQQRDLHFRRTGVFIMPRVVLHDDRFFSFFNRHYNRPHLYQMTPDKPDSWPIGLKLL